MFAMRILLYTKIDGKTPTRMSICELVLFVDDRLVISGLGNVMAEMPFLGGEADETEQQFEASATAVAMALDGAKDNRILPARSRNSWRSSVRSSPSSHHLASSSNASDSAFSISACRSS